MKRIIKILSVMTMCLMLVLGIVACDKPHTHTFNENAWDSNETQHWHPATCGHPEEKKDVAAHEDGNDDGKCDVCDADMPEAEKPDNPTPHTHTFDETVWASDETQHWHPSNCGHPEQKKDVADHKDDNDDGKCDVCDKKDGEYYNAKLTALIDKIATEENFTFKLKINEKNYEFKFFENGFDIPAFTVDGVDVTVRMRDNRIYIHREYENAEPTLEYISLPEELMALKVQLSDVISDVKTYIKDELLAMIDVTEFLDLNKTESGYEFVCDKELSDVLNTIILPTISQIGDMSLNDILSQVISFDIASLIDSLKFEDGMTVGELINMLNTLLQKNIDLGDTISAMNIDDLIKKITGNPDATLNSLLASLSSFLKNTTIKSLLSFIPFDDIAKVEFSEFNFYLKITTDNDYSIESTELKLDGKYAIDDADRSLDFEGGFSIENKGATEPDDFDMELLESNLKFAADNSLDETLITTLLKALINKYVGGIIDIDQLKTYYNKIVILIKSQSVNVSTLQSLGLTKSEPDENGNYTLSFDAALSSLLSDLINSAIPAIQNNYPDSFDTLPALNGLLSLLGKDNVDTISGLLDNLSTVLSASLGLLDMMSSFPGYPQVEVVTNLIDTLCDFMGITKEKAWEFFKRYDENIPAPSDDDTIGSYMAKTEKIAYKTFRQMINDIVGSGFSIDDYLTNYIQPIINALKTTMMKDLADKLTVKISFRITVNADNTVTNVALGISYAVEDVANGFFPLISFSANLPEA